MIGTDMYRTTSPRKNGRVDSTHGVLIEGKPFGDKGRAVRTIPGNTDNLAMSPGLLRDVSGSGDLSQGRPQRTSPHSGKRDTGTLGNRYIASSPEGVGHTVAQGDLTEVGPHEHGTILRKNILFKLPVHTAFGAASDSKTDQSTAFHNVGSKVSRPRPTRSPATAGERTHAQSWTSGNSATGHAGHDTQVGRWATVKHGAAG